jgi:plastocyanin
VGAVWRLHRWVALAGDMVQHSESGTEAGWSAGLQLAIPYTPHTLSLHVSNVNATTLQSSSIGVEGRRLWGFEFTVPVTLSRYFGGREARPAPALPGHEASRGSGSVDTTRVTMDNRLQFLPDTVRVSVGGVVVWSNTSDIVHTVTADPARAANPETVRLPAGAVPFDSGGLVPGDAFAHRFDRAGEYRYVCLPHELAGMVGVVIVEE